MTDPPRRRRHDRPRPLDSPRRLDLVHRVGAVVFGLGCGRSGSSGWSGDADASVDLAAAERAVAAGLGTPDQIAGVRAAAASRGAEDRLAGWRADRPSDPTTGA
jgi:hypothetical protein